MRGLALRQKGFAELLAKNPEQALARMTTEDIPLLYWTAAAWGAEVSMDVEDLEAVADLPRIEALMRRGLALDEAWDEGALHALLMSYELSRPDGGARAQEDARRHFERATALSKGTRLSDFVTWAQSSSVKRQDRREFNALLDQVLAFPLDQRPDRKLANTLAQQQARRLKASVDDLFL
jgi:hypothetical protein